MPVSDEEFLAELLAAFQVEAAEHVQLMSSALIEIEKSTTSISPVLLESVCREAHSLKGAARAVDARAIERICQPLEDIFLAWKYRELTPAPPHFTPIYRAVELIGELIQTPTEKRINDGAAKVIQSLQDVAAPPVVESAAENIEWDAEIAALTSFTAPPAPETATQPDFFTPDAPIIAVEDNTTVAPTPQVFIEAPSEPIKSPSAPIETPKVSPAIETSEAAPLAIEKQPVTETVRISIQKLDSLLLQAEEMLMVKLTAAERVGSLMDIGVSLEPWEKEWRKLSPALRAAKRTLDKEDEELPDLRKPLGRLIEFLEWNHAFVQELENKIAAVHKAAALDARTTNGLVENLLDDAKKLLMLPFATLFRVLPKMVRDLAHDQNKNVLLILRGDDIEIDKRILEGMKSPLIHLLRNSIDHGIETPLQRQNQGKDGQARLTVAVERLSGSEVQISVSDDGAGINVAKIRENALKTGVATPAELDSWDEAQILALIFQSGFSTSSIITEISGRGLGMAIVREQVEKLGGRITLETHRGQGTQFRIILPLTLSSFKGIVVRVAGQIFVLPTSDVERVIRLRAADIKTIENRETILVQRADGGRDLISLARLGGVLELGRSDKSATDEFVEIVVLGAHEKRIAFVVDEIVNEQEVLVKPFAAPLVRVRNVAGATVLGSGKAVPILNVADLLKSAQGSGASMNLQASSPETGETPHDKAILVAEDSITARMLLKNILESSGYRVTTAVDGMDALTTLKTGEFDAVISDVDMPRMNGFDLTAAIRHENRWAALPIILVTARESREDRERGIDVGANAYLVKSSFDQSNLLSVLQSLV